MPAAIKIQIQNQTSQGFDALRKDLAGSADAAGELEAAAVGAAKGQRHLAEATEESAAAQMRVTKIVHEETVSFSKLATGIAGATAAGLQYAETAARIAFVNGIMAKVSQTAAAGVAALGASQ